MIPPKYKFYVGILNTTLGYSSNTTINDEGEVISEFSKYTYGPTGISDENAIILDLISISSYNRIYFYDINKKMITYYSLIDYNNRLIEVPKGTKYYALRFTKGDSNFYAKVNNTTFTYILQQVNPHYKELNKKYTKENDQQFFRTAIEGKITLHGLDYNFIRRSRLEDKLIFVIYKLDNNTNAYNTYYKGEFNKTSCKFDYNKNSCELKTEPLDEYTNIMNKYDSTYDLIKLAPALTKVSLHKRSLMQVYIRGANSISNFFGGTYWEDDVNEVVDSHDDLINKYHFAYLKSGNEVYITGSNVSEVNTVYAGTNKTQYWDSNTIKYRLRYVLEIQAGVISGYPKTVYNLASKESRGVKESAFGEVGRKLEENLYTLQIINTSTGTAVYKSKYMFYTDPNSDDRYVGRDDIEFNSINADYAGSVILNMYFVYHIYRRLLCDVDTVTDSEGTKNTYDLPQDDFVVDNRNYKKCIGLLGGLFYCTARTETKPTKFGMNDYGEYFTDLFIPSYVNAGRPLPISRNSWANASLWYVYDKNDLYFDEKLRKKYTIKDTYKISDVIKALLSEIDPTITHEDTEEYSQFLYARKQPLDVDRFSVLITQKTNILKGNYDQAAQKAEITFEDLMNMLRDCFRCYWYIEDNKLKIEHINFFMNGGSYTNVLTPQLDFTKLCDAFNKKPADYFQAEVEYNKSDLNARYEFNWMDDATEAFGGLTIDVNSNYVQKDKKEEINVSSFSSDIDFMLFNPSNFSDDGFALLCPIKIIQSDRHFCKIEIHKGDLCSIVNQGTWCLVDTDYIVRQKSSDTTAWLIPNVVTAEQDGYLYINCFAQDTSKFELLITNPTTYKNLSYNNSVLEAGYYYATIVDIGSRLHENPIEWHATEYYEIPIVETNLVDDHGEGYKAILQNFYASWANLVRLYMYDMPAENISCNKLDNLYVNRVKACLEHTITCQTENDLSAIGVIKTNIGTGIIDDININLSTRSTKIKLKYEPE